MQAMSLRSRISRLKLKHKTSQHCGDRNPYSSPSLSIPDHPDQPSCLRSLWYTTARISTQNPPLILPMFPKQRPHVNKSIKKHKERLPSTCREYTVLLKSKIQQMLYNKHFLRICILFSAGFKRPHWKSRTGNVT